MLRLRTFGGCFLERDGTRLDGVSSQRKGLGLLALLAVSDAGLSRESAAAFLWPESDEARSSASLKQLVHSLRQQLGAPDVLLGPTPLRLNPDVITSDVAEFRSAVALGDMDVAASLYSGPFLDGFLIRDADAFERWVSTTRATLASQHAEVLETLAERASAQGDMRGSVTWWRRLQSADPLSGRVAVGLMRALDVAGDRAGALRHAQIHDELLRQELGSSASDPLVADLAAELRSTPVPSERDRGTGDVQPVVAPSGSARVDHGQQHLRAEDRKDAHEATRKSPSRTRMNAAWALFAVAAVVVIAMTSYYLLRPDHAPAADTAVAPSVAVLPFVNTSGDEADEPFADGLTDELIVELGQVAGLKVAPRTSTFALKGKGLDIRTAADTLGVATALEGSVRRSGERLRVTVGLVDADENRVLWSQTYDRELKDVFAVQQEIASAVVRALQVTLAPATSRTHSGTADVVAYELFLKGQFFRYRLNREALQRAIGFFEQAIARDPGYARAYAGLSDAHALLVLFGNEPPREGFQRSRTAALKALEIDSTLAQAHASLGHIATAHDWDWSTADVRFKRAMLLDPSSTQIRLWYCLWLLDQRRFDDARPLLEQALAADPLSMPVRMTLGRLYVSRREPDRAIPYLRETIELYPQLSFAHQQLGHALLLKNMNAEAVETFRTAAALSGVRDSAHLAYAYAVSGREVEARRIVQILVQSSTRRYVSPFDIAVSYAGLGDADEAFRWLEKAFAEHAAAMDTIAITPALASLHADPRWARLLQRMGLPT